MEMDDASPNIIINKEVVCLVNFMILLGETDHHACSPEDKVVN